MKFLALDIGEKRVGLASGDELGVGVWPQKNFLRQGTERDYEALAERIEEYGPRHLIIGLPVNMDGSEGPQAKKVRQFAAKLEEALSAKGIAPEIAWCDERLSSWEAENQLREKGFKGKKVKESVDSMAACLILEDYLRSKGIL